MVEGRTHDDVVQLGEVDLASEGGHVELPELLVRGIDEGRLLLPVDDERVVGRSVLKPELDVKPGQGMSSSARISQTQHGPPALQCVALLGLLGQTQGSSKGLKPTCPCPNPSSEASSSRP